jgi:hypothetical protein
MSRSQTLHVPNVSGAKTRGCVDGTFYCSVIAELLICFDFSFHFSGGATRRRQLKTKERKRGKK